MQKRLRFIITDTVYNKDVILSNQMLIDSLESSKGKC